MSVVARGFPVESTLLQQPAIQTRLGQRRQESDHGRESAEESREAGVALPLTLGVKIGEALGLTNACDCKTLIGARRLPAE